MKPKLEIARPTQFSQLIGAIPVFAIWVAGFITQGWLIALEYSWILLFALALGGSAVLRRLKFNDASVEVSVGPFRHRADLTKLRSINYRTAYGGRGPGILYVSDESGARVSIYLDYFTKSSEWAAALLKAAAATGAQVQPVARHILQSEADSESG